MLLFAERSNFPRKVTPAERIIVISRQKKLRHNRFILLFAKRSNFPRKVTPAERIKASAESKRALIGTKLRRINTVKQWEGFGREENTNEKPITGRINAISRAVGIRMCKEKGLFLPSGANPGWAVMLGHIKFPASFSE